MRWSTEASQTARVMGGLGGVLALALAIALSPYLGCASQESAAVSTDTQTATAPSDATAPR